MLTSGGNVGPEAGHRADSANQAFFPLARKLHACPYFPVDHRMQLLRMLLLSRLGHNAGTWAARKEDELVRFKGAYMRYMRCVHRHAYDHISDKQVLDEVDAPAPEMLLTVARLAFFSRLCRFGADSTKALAQTNAWDDSSWAALVRQDLEVLRSAVPPLRSMPDPVEDVQSWQDLACRSPQ
eukprot:7695093-Alexandrium_andersonii.AAC.1